MGIPVFVSLRKTHARERACGGKAVIDESKETEYTQSAHTFLLHVRVVHLGRCVNCLGGTLHFPLSLSSKRLLAWSRGKKCVFEQGNEHTATTPLSIPLLSYSIAHTHPLSHTLKTPISKHSLTHTHTHIHHTKSYQLISFLISHFSFLISYKP